MSRVGKKPVDIPQKVKVEIKDNLVEAKGPLGSLTFNIPKGISIAEKENKLFISVADKKIKNINAIYGTVRARINNLILGVAEGFEKTLEIKGLGYRANVSGKKLNLELGFSHPVAFDIPDSVTVIVDSKKNTITMKGADKIVVGDIAARIKRLRVPEPYKGSGVRYLGEQITRKAGKAASAGAKK